MVAQSKWYQKTWFIGLMYVLWPIYGIPLVIAIVLTYLQVKENKALADKYGDVDAMDAYVKQKEEESANIIETAQVQASSLVDMAKKEAEGLKAAINSLKEEKQSLINTLNREKQILAEEIKALSKEAIVEAVNFSAYEGITSEECKDRLTVLKMKQTELIKADKALVVTSGDPKKVLNNNIKQLIRCFNSECNYIVDNASVKNIDKSRNRMQKSFEVLNSIFATDGVALSYDFLEMKLEELNLVYAYELKKEEEREIQRAIREQMIEEEKVRKEIEREKIKIEKEESQFRNEVSKLMKYMQASKNDMEKDLYIQKIKELEEKLSLLEKDKENILQREQNTRAGFVYVISNIGSMGDDVYKIGMTRRLEPMDRIKELSDASVPFPFDLHALIFSEDAPSLENILHQTFKAQEVNKVNPRKEFFRIPLDAIKNVVKENFNATVHFTDIADALEYRETLRINEKSSA